MGGQGNIFSVHVAILMRVGVTIFKMPPSTAATVNQFPNPKVSDVEREGEGEEGQGGHLLFLIRMDQSSSLALSHFISGSLVLSFTFLCSLSSLYPLAPPLSPPHFRSSPRDLNGGEWGCHFKMSPVETRTHSRLYFSTPPPVPLLVTYTSVCFWDFPTFHLQSQRPALWGSAVVVAHIQCSDSCSWF